MTSEEEQPTQAWLDHLDRLLAGQEHPAVSEDELLLLAQQLHTAMTPLRTLHQAEEHQRQHLLGRLHSRHALEVQTRPAALTRRVLLVALVLLVVLTGGALGTRAWGSLWSAAGQTWNAATSLQQVQGVSLTQLERAYPGLHPLPLLPTTLPGDTENAVYGVLTDARDVELLKGFVADYRIAGQEVALFEQPSSVPLTSAAAQPVLIGTLHGQVFQDATGDHALQWYQDRMECQLTSRLSVERLVALARLFQPITTWDVLR
jgi:hypothetical protein